MTNQLHNYQLEERWNNFILKIKTELTDKNKKYQKITDINGNNPEQLHELIDKQLINFNTYWIIKDNYEISNMATEEINKIFDNS